MHFFQRIVSVNFENIIMRNETDKVIFVIVATVVITKERKEMAYYCVVTVSKSLINHSSTS